MLGNVYKQDGIINRLMEDRSLYMFSPDQLLR